MSKNLKIKITLFLSLFILSCSKDDGPKKEYFPTKITTNFSSNPDLTITTTIEYDDKNRIVKFKYENNNRTDSYEVVYDSDNLISLVKFKKVNSGTTTTKSLLFSYTNSYLQKLEILSSSGVQTINITFDVVTNTYSLDNSPYNKFKLDLNNNIINYRFSGTEVNLSYNENNGVYNNCNSLLLLIASGGNETSDLYFTLYSSLFFSNKEITLVSAGTFPTATGYHLLPTRDSKNNIISIDYLTYGTDNIYCTSTIEYDQKTIN